MTRINVIRVEELSDLHLLAEYRELPRVVLGNFKDVSKSSDSYILGVGHVKWAKKHEKYLLQRFKNLVEELKYRGFTPNYTYDSLSEVCKGDGKDYHVTVDDIKLNESRILERLKTSKKKHIWSKREIPSWVKKGLL